MDEAQDLVPSGKVTACSESNRRLVAQARKYGLGLLFATQAPKARCPDIARLTRGQFYTGTDGTKFIKTRRRCV